MSDLLLANCTSREKTRTNMVFLNPATLRLFQTDKIEVTFGASLVVQRVTGDEKLGAQELGTNALVRAALGLTENDVGNTKISVAPYKPKDTALCQVTFEINHFAKVQTTIDAQDVENHILEFMVKETFCPRQGFATKMGNTWIKVNCVQCMAPVAARGSDPEVKEVPCGEINDTTQIVLTPAANRKLVWKARRENKLKIGPSFDGEAMGIGGLNKQFEQIFRRAFASRLLPVQMVQELGIKHVKGMLLFGPPGTGKTLIARTIGSMLTERAPKVVNGPEILNRFVGASEEKIRALFEEARADQKENGDDADLHIIIFDEIDAICKARGSVGGGTGVHDTVVNQLLSMIDGVDSLNNILVIGMTNRKDLIDTALLRPGRLEVHLEIGLPDTAGREQIFRIKTKNMTEHGRLGEDVSISDLAELTKNYSGAEIEGVVKSAVSFSYYNMVDKKDLKSLAKRAKDMMVGMEHFQMALDEVKPEFGVSEDALTVRLERGFHSYGEEFEELMFVGKQLLEQVINPNNRTRRLSLLLEGPIGCGKTAMACKLALEAHYPFVKLVSAENMVAFADQTKALKINQIFEDAYKSNASIVILDDIERLLGYTPVGPRFSTKVMETLQVLCRKDPPYGRSLCVIATSTSRVINDLSLREIFDVVKEVPLVSHPSHIKAVMKSSQIDVESMVLELIANSFDRPIGIKRLQMIIESSLAEDGTLSHEAFTQAMQLYGYNPCS